MGIPKNLVFFLLLASSHQSNAVKLVDGAVDRHMASSGKKLAEGSRGAAVTPTAVNSSVAAEVQVKSKGLPTGLVEKAVQGVSLFGFIFGVCLLLFALVVQWMNEMRSARVAGLLVRGIDECRSVDPCPDVNNRGRLVHVQGHARGVAPITDARFQDAVVLGSLRLQSTLEVLEWVPLAESGSTRTDDGGTASNDGKQNFRQEWTTTHQDSLHFRKPSPDNPKLSFGGVLGTTTKISKRVELGAEHGAFILTEEMLAHFHKFEQAMIRLPEVVHLGELPFIANTADGYFYARPSLPTSRVPSVGTFEEPRVGDLRVRFLHVPECEATAVGVQCQTGADESFVPYRLIARGVCCLSDEVERDRLVEAGRTSRLEYRADESACFGRDAESCMPYRILAHLCCPCVSLASFCTREIVTEEILYVSDHHDPVQKPFNEAVRRSIWRVAALRVLGWGMMWLAIRAILNHAQAVVESYTLSSDATGTALWASIIASALVYMIASCPYRGPVWTFQTLCCLGFGPAAPIPCGCDCEKRRKADAK